MSMSVSITVRLSWASYRLAFRNLHLLRLRFRAITYDTPFALQVFQTDEIVAVDDLHLVVPKLVGQYLYRLDSFSVLGQTRIGSVV